jgi:uncharacterized protein
VLGLIARIVLSSMVSGGIHFYVWLRLVKRAHLPRRWHIGITIAMLVLFVSIPVTTWSRNEYPSFSATVGWVSLPWMALVGLTFVALVVMDLVRLSRGIVRRVVSRIRRRAVDSPHVRDVSRRTFLARVTGGAALAIGGTSVARGMIEARGEHEVVDVEVPLAKLPRSLDGFTIVQLSDLHIGMTIDRAFVQRVVDRANALSPDLIALTGDLVDGRVEDLRAEAAPLAQLRGKHGVFAVTGNHEYYSGADPWIEEIRGMGVRYLRNERVTVGSGDDAFELAGVDDHSADGWAGHGEDIPRALAGRDAKRALVLLAHQPRQVRRAANHGVDLQLSGHTHGGQIWPWHYIVKVQQGGLLAGRYEVKGTQLYVTRGCGYWGPPVRLLAPLEITRVILRAV